METMYCIPEHKIEKWVKTRKDIHQHPELAFDETRTSTLVAEKLEKLGFSVEKNIGKTGVVGTLKGTKTKSDSSDSIKRLGIRADMDALPIQEINQFDHASTHPGVMHACGHDGHTTILLATAEQLAANPDFNGEIVFIFQPAEEGGAAGAKAMIDDGILSKYPLDAVFALHNWPGLEVGEFAVHPGPVMASSNEFHVVVHGKGCHAAMPDLGIDPILIGSQLIQTFQTIISRNIKPIDSGVISITKFNAGNAINVIPESATISGTVRTFNNDVLDLIEKRIKDISHEICKAMGATAQVCFKRAYPPTINNKSMADLAAKALKKSGYFKEIHQDLPPTMGAEDFSFFLEKVPGAYLWLGNGDGAHREAGHGIGPCMLHNPSYDFNDQILPYGVQGWMCIIKAFLSE